MSCSLLDFLDPEQESTTLQLGQTKYFLSKIGFPFSILSLNIRSLRKNFNNLQALLHTLDYTFSVICVSETHLTDDEHKIYNLPGYDCLSVPRNQFGGGVLIYYLSTMNCTLLPEISKIFNNFESLFISWSLNGAKYIIGNVYRPPGKSLNSFNQEFSEKIIESLPSTNVYISGDFNINLFESCTNNNIDFALNLSEINLQTKITCPTRVFSTSVSTSSTLLDHVWDSTSRPSEHIVISHPISDHFPTLSIYDMPYKNTAQTYPARTISTKCKREFCARFDLFLDTFYRLGSFTDPESAMTILLTHLSDNLNTSFPIRLKTEKARKVKCPWMTKRLEELVHKKHSIFKNCKRNIFPFSQFRIYRNMLKLLELAKALHYKTHFSEISSDSKATWKLINQCLNKEKSDKYPIEFLHNDAIINDDNEATNIFAKSFFEIKKPQAPHNRLHSSRFLNFPIHGNSAFFQPFTNSEIIIAISQLKKNSFHTSEIPVELIQLIAPKLSLFLTPLFNSCLDKGIFPQCLKSAFIKPRYKKGKKSLISNYRPISVLNTISKIFEDVIYSRLINFFQTNNLFSPQQFGYLKGKGIEKAALTFLYDIYQAKLEGLSSAATFIDFSKAFDTIDHKILLRKLYCYGIRGPPLQLISSFLSNRIYQVRLRSSLSNPISPGPTGTPQGSCLSALLFIIYINDITTHLKHCKILMYADDLVLYHCSSDIRKLQSEMQSDLDTVSSYAEESLLYINLTKTKSMFFKATPNTPTIDLTLHNQDIEQVDQFTYLGLIIDKRLTFKPHILHITKKLNTVNRTIHCLSSKLPFNILLRIFYSIGFPHVNLHIVAWGGAIQSSLYPLNIALNKIVRNIRSKSHLFNLSTYEAYNKFNILTVNKLYELKLAEFMFCGIKNNGYILQDYITHYRWNHSYHTRQPSEFRLPLCRSTNDQIYFIFRALKLWSTIPTKLKELDSITNFHRETKLYLLGKSSKLGPQV